MKIFSCVHLVRINYNSYSKGLGQCKSDINLLCILSFIVDIFKTVDLYRIAVTIVNKTCCYPLIPSSLPCVQMRKITYFLELIIWIAMVLTLVVSCCKNTVVFLKIQLLDKA